MQRRRFLHASVLPLAMSRLLPAESTAKPGDAAEEDSLSMQFAWLLWA